MFIANQFMFPVLKLSSYLFIKKLSGNRYLLKSPTETEHSGEELQTKLYQF